MAYLIGMLFLIVFIVVSITMIFFVLIQQAKGGGLTGAFGGGGGSEAFFGPSGATGVAKLTIGLAIAFMVLALMMEFIGPVTLARTEITAPSLGTGAPAPPPPAAPAMPLGE